MKHFIEQRLYKKFFQLIFEKKFEIFEKKLSKETNKKDIRKIFQISPLQSRR